MDSPCCPSKCPEHVYCIGSDPCSNTAPAAFSLGMVGKTDPPSPCVHNCSLYSRKKAQTRGTEPRRSGLHLTLVHRVPWVAQHAVSDSQEKPGGEPLYREIRASRFLHSSCLAAWSQPPCGMKMESHWEFLFFFPVRNCHRYSEFFETTSFQRDALFTISLLCPS